ncbi:MAG: Gfo/Idh/MocA family oxidoreductase, partial [Pseudomonadota bacterium]
EVSSVYDPVDHLARAAAETADGALVHETFDEMIADDGLDAFVIASPNHVHMDQLEAITARRNLPIICEKPIFTKNSDYGRLRRLQEGAKAPIWVAMEYRYMPPIAALLKQVDGVTGGVKMLTIREHRFPFLDKVGDWNRFNRNTGGTLVEKCCHFFDLMRLILRSEPVRVTASGGQITNHLTEVYEGDVPDIWDGAYVIFDFENGARAMLELCMFADGTIWNEEITAVGPAGKIDCRIPGPQRFWPDDLLGPSPHPEVTVYPREPKRPETVTIELDPSLVAAGDHHGSTFFQHQKFLNVVRGQGQPEVTLDDGAIAVLMGLAAQQAALEKRVLPVRLEREIA